MIRLEDTHSLCKECARLGWVSEEDYSNDVEASEMWPDSIRKIYYSLTDVCLHYTREYKFYRILFLSTAFCYIQWMNGIELSNKRFLFMFPFLAMITPMTILACILNEWYNLEAYKK